ncbi:hypothetical protein MTO96_024041 [Rhipicephalus appendiculatus]
MIQPDSSYRFARFSVTADMSPSVRVLAYAFHEGHLLADSLVIEVEEACLEKAAITVETDFKSERPGANGSVKILGSSGTRVGILGINKQVSELASEGLLTSSKMFANLNEQSPDVTRQDTSCQPLSRRRSSRRRLTRSLQYESASVAFLNKCCWLGERPDHAGRSCMARADIVRHHIRRQKGEQCADAYMHCCSRAFGPVFYGVAFAKAYDPKPYPEDLPTFKHPLSELPTFDWEDEYDEAHDLPPDSVIRNDFRETWLFDERAIGPDGVAEIATSLPHSITTWSVQAVSVAPTGGVCIPQPREVRAFQPFFLQVALPYSVVRKEQIEVLATVYNYVNETILCPRLRVRRGRSLHGYTRRENAPKGEPSQWTPALRPCLTFPVIPLREGRFTIKVHAHCNHSSGHSAGTHDAVEKELHVVPEGVPVEKVGFRSD